MEQEILLGLIADFEQQQKDFMLALSNDRAAMTAALTKERAALSQERAELAAIGRQLATTNAPTINKTSEKLDEIERLVTHVRNDVNKIKEKTNWIQPFCWSLVVVLALVVIYFKWQIQDLPDKTAEKVQTLKTTKIR